MVKLVEKERDSLEVCVSLCLLVVFFIIVYKEDIRINGLMLFL